MVPVPTIAMRCIGFGEVMVTTPLLLLAVSPRQPGAHFSANASAPSYASWLSSRLCASSFDLDDVGAEVRQHHRRGRGRDEGSLSQRLSNRRTRIVVFALSCHHL